MNRSRLSTLLGILVFAWIALGSTIVWSRKPKAPMASSPADALRSTSISALGTIAPRGKIRHVAAPSSFSRVGDLFVNEGDSVTQGQVLAYSDDRRLRLSELEQATAQVEIAQSKLDRFLAGPDPHEVDALVAALTAAVESRDQRKREFDRASILAQSRSISEEELEGTRLRWNLANWAVSELQSKRQLLQSVRDEDARVLRAELQATIGRKATAFENAALSEITSPIEGVVLRIHVREGERPTDAGILDLGDTRRMQVIAEVYEADALHLHPGAEAQITLKSHPQQLRGIVSHVRPVVGRKSVLDNDPISDSDARVVETTIDLEDDDAFRVHSLSNAAVTVVIRVDEP
jgi:HlyD family secretion protein